MNITAPPDSQKVPYSVEEKLRALEEREERQKPYYVAGVGAPSTTWQGSTANTSNAVVFLASDLPKGALV